MNLLIPLDVYNALHDFVMERETDIEIDFEDLGRLKIVLEWIKKVEAAET